jgi:hypothetical protein
MPMFARVECVFVLRASISCMNDYTWRRRRRCSSHTAHRQIRHPVDPHAPSLPSLFGTFMLAIESPNEDLGRGTSRRNKHLRLRFRWARPGRLGRESRATSVTATGRLHCGEQKKSHFQASVESGIKKHTSNNKSNNFNVASQKVALSGLGLNQSSATSPLFFGQSPFRTFPQSRQPQFMLPKRRFGKD